MSLTLCHRTPVIFFLDGEDPMLCHGSSASADLPGVLPDLAWIEIVDLCVRQTFATDSFCSHFRTHAVFSFVPPASSCRSAFPSLPPQHLAALLPSETDWSSALDADNPSISVPPVPASSVLAPDLATPLGAVHAWLRAGCCRQADGALNLKQAAALTLHALWLQDACAHQQSLSAGPPPRDFSICLGGPGTGKSYILRLCQTLSERFFPGATRTCALMHTAARLVHGRTLHSALAIPLEPITSKNKSLGERKESFLHEWSPVRSLLLDEVSTIPAELFGSAEFRACQAKDTSAAWGGLHVAVFGDFAQLPPVLATTLASKVEPPPELSLPGRRLWLQRHAPALRGRSLWLQFKNCLLLDYSHRCQGPLAKLLAELLTPAGFSSESWRLLQARVLVANDPRLADPLFTSPEAVIGVQRHSLRALLTLERAQTLASGNSHRLWVIPAADSLRRDDRGPALDPAFLRRVLAVHNLSKTKNLPGFLFLWLHCDLLLEAVLCPELGITRGCRVRLLDIVLHPGQTRPSSDPSLPAFIFDRLPAALLLEVPGATWIKDAALGPGRFLLSLQTRSFSFHPGAADAMFCPAQVSRTQLPVANAIAYTAYALQGATVPAIFLDLAKPTGTSREDFWMSLYVLLSRVTSLEQILIFRLPSMSQCIGGPPSWLQSELARLSDLQRTTVASIDQRLAAYNRADLQQLITRPLLSHLPAQSSSACVSTSSSSYVSAPPLRRRRLQ